MSPFSLEGLLEADSRIQEPEPTNLNDFFKFMQLCEAEQFNGLESDANIFAEFKKLIHDMNRCALTGSSVLNARLNKESDSQDIDFFIEHNVENIKTVSRFFESSHFKKAFRNFSENYLDAKKDRNINFKEGNFKKTSFEEAYSLVKLDATLETYRFNFSSINDYKFDLNMIFVKRLTIEEGSILGFQEQVTTSLYHSKFMDTDNKLTFAPFIFPSKFNEKSEDTMELYKIYPVGLPIHIINDTFDFEELKYVYNFDLQQPITTFMAGKLLLSKFKEQSLQFHLDGIISKNILDKIENRIDYVINDLEIRNKLFIESTNDPRNLTVSKCIIPRSSWDKIKYDVDNYLRGDPINNSFSSGSRQNLKVANHCYATYHNIMARVPKYEERGFNICDPDNLIAILQSYINLHTTYMMQQPNMNAIAQRSILMSGARKDTKLLKLLRESYKVFSSLSEVANIKLDIKKKVGPPDAEPRTISQL